MEFYIICDKIERVRPKSWVNFLQLVSTYLYLLYYIKNIKNFWRHLSGHVPEKKGAA